MQKKVHIKNKVKVKINSIFRKFATAVSGMAGNAYTFVIAILIIILWASTGSLFGYSNTWQLVINTFTTITTFIMVFLIQNTQNRDSKAIHLKLDELLKSIKGARDEIINIEELPDELIEDMHNEFRDLQTKYTKKIKEVKPEKTGKIESIFSSFFKMIDKG